MGGINSIRARMTFAFALQTAALMALEIGRAHV